MNQSPEGSRRDVLPRFSFGLLVFLMLLASGCASVSPSPPVEPPCIPAPRPVPRETPGQPSTVEMQLREEAALWENTPHRMGGNTQRGVDCSGLVMEIIRKRFGICLPRTTEEQIKEGIFISKNELQAGDLVFFRPPEYKYHVGIYLSRGEFLHTSYSNGVMISNLHDQYWRKWYWTARRILPLPSQ